MSFTNETDKQKYYIEKCSELIAAKEQKLGRKLTACVVTFGCQMNFKDSEKLMGILSQIGYQETDDEHADLVLYNTCTVRENANLKIYGRLGYLSKIKEKNPEMIIGLCGCMMQEPQVVEKLNKSYRFVDIIFGTHNVFQLAELLYDRLIGGHRIEDIWDGTTEIVEDLPTIRKYDFKSGVNIMYGCNNFCSYCIVPYVRGRERSRNPEDIVKEVEELVSNGVVEVMLLGQNVNSYGKTLDNPISFAKLLEMVEQVEGLKRIRFMTSHPKDLSDELIEVMAKSKKIYSEHLPHNNTVEDFEETLDVVRKARYDSAFTFIYSKRSGTPAATMPDQVPEDVVKERFDRLLNLVNEISREKTKHLEGTVQSVLVEELNKKIPGYVTGRLSNNSVVHFEGCKELIGKIVDVNLKEAKGFYYMGEMVK